MKKEHVEFIDRLREAAREHGAVVDLLVCLDATILLDGIGNHEIIFDEWQIEYLKAALLAANFVMAERGLLDDGAEQ